MAKILIINLPSHGHVNPTLALAKELSNREHEVSYLITEEFREEIELTGASVISYDEKIKNVSSIKNSSYVPIIYGLAQEIGGDYDCIIYEMAFHRGKELGDFLNKPTIRLISTFAFNKNMANSLLKSTHINLEVSHQYKKSLIRYYQRSLADIPKLNLVYTCREFQVHGEEFEHDIYKFVGPSICKRIIKTDIPFNGLRENVIYISFGSIINISTDFFEKCVQAFTNIDASVIMSIGKKISIETLKNVPRNFMIYPSVPQLEVLKYTTVFITHGGMNSVHEAIYYNVPMIVIPQCADQPVVARRLEELNLGKVLNKDQVSVENLKAAVNEIFHNPIYKSNINKMSEAMIKAGGYKASVDEIEKYLIL